MSVSHLVLISVLITAIVDLCAVEPANPNASPDTRKILTWLEQLPQRADHRVISGQNAGVNGEYEAAVVALHNQTGIWPGMIGLSYCRFPNGLLASDPVTEHNQQLTDYWNAGGLVSIWHSWYNPWTGGDCRDLTQGSIDDLLTAGTTANQRWQAEKDAIAAGLTILQNRGVVVLFKAPHEMNGTWFWWGQLPGDGFVRLWRDLFDDFTYRKHLNNLLWVWGPNNGVAPIASYYPGDGYVDVVGPSLYSTTQTMDPGDRYAEMIAYHKPFAVIEAGSNPAGGDGSWDNRILINAVRSDHPAASFFYVWNGWGVSNRMAIAENQHAQELLDDPWIINRDGIDWRSVPDDVHVSYDDANLGSGIGQFLFIGTWTTEGTAGGSNGAYQGDEHTTTSADAVYSVRFIGTQVSVRATAESDGGMIGCAIDGGAETVIDSSNPTRLYQHVLWSSAALNPGTHTLRVRATGSAGSGGGHVLRADRIVIVPAPDQPTITPNGGNFTGPVSVTLTDSTSGSAIRYTIDGSTPTGTSPLYTSAFTLTTSATVKAVVFNGSALSAVASAVFTITTASINPPTNSTNPPITSINGQGKSKRRCGIGSGIASMIFVVCAAWVCAFTRRCRHGPGGDMPRIVP